MSMTVRRPLCIVDAEIPPNLHDTARLLACPLAPAFHPAATSAGRRHGLGPLRPTILASAW